MTIFTGYQVSSGAFTSDKGQRVEYDNRILHFLSDDEISDGSAGFLVSSPLKVKAVVLADSLGCDILHVDKMLQQCLFSQIEFKMPIIKGVPTVTGFKVVGNGVNVINTMYGKAEK